MLLGLAGKYHVNIIIYDLIALIYYSDYMGP